MNQKRFNLRKVILIKITINILIKSLIIVLFQFIFFGKLYSQENFVLTTVNKLPITNIDVVNRAKLISFSMNKDLNFKNLHKFYNQSLNSLIEEKIIQSEGLLINKNLNKIVYKKALQLALLKYDNSELKLDQFVKKLSITKSTILEKYQGQLIWANVLGKKYKLQLNNLEKKIEQIIKNKKLNKNEDLYDLAEIIIEKKNNFQLLEQINLALKRGVSFLEIAKQVSISRSAKFSGKIGWKNYKELPNQIKIKNNVINEGDVFSFPLNNELRIIKVLAKRTNGQISKLENELLLARINFKINFQKKNIVYENTKKVLLSLLDNKKSCDNLKKISSQNVLNLRLKIIKSRIADLSPSIKKLTENKNLYEISKPLFNGNDGYAYIICDKRIKKIRDNVKQIRKQILDKQFLIFSDKLLKKLKKEANIIHINNLDKI